MPLDDATNEPRSALSATVRDLIETSRRIHDRAVRTRAHSSLLSMWLMSTSYALAMLATGLYSSIVNGEDAIDMLKDCGLEPREPGAPT